MSSSFIEYKGRGYWISDGFIGLVANYIKFNLNPLEHKEKWVIEFINSLSSICSGNSIGWNSFHFDELLTSTARVYFVVTTIDKTISFVRSKGNFIPKDELNSYESIKEKKFIALWSEDIETKRILNLLLDIKLLIQEKGGFLHSDEIDYFW